MTQKRLFEIALLSITALTSLTSLPALALTATDSLTSGTSNASLTNSNSGSSTSAANSLAVSSASSTAPSAAATNSLQLPRTAIVNGGLVVLPLPEGLHKHELYYHGQRVWTGTLKAPVQARPGKPGNPASRLDQPLVAVIGIGLDASGEQLLTRTAGGKAHDQDGGSSNTSNNSDDVALRFEVSPQVYPEQHLTLTETKYVNPDVDELARYAREAAEQKAAYRVFSEPSLHQWPTFRWPLVGRISSPFGMRRFFNGEPRAPHLGVDIAGTMGTPGLAPADGTVVLTGDYFFNGRTVIIDHGQGLYSMLCHFSEVKVKAGDVVHAGDVVGLVGMTGRATAPHLHWTVSLNDERIDPRLLLAEKVLPTK